MSQSGMIVLVMMDPSPYDTRAGVPPRSLCVPLCLTRSIPVYPQLSQWHATPLRVLRYCLCRPGQTPLTGHSFGIIHTTAMSNCMGDRGTREKHVVFEKERCSATRANSQPRLRRTRRPVTGAYTLHRRLLIVGAGHRSSGRVVHPHTKLPPLDRS